MDKIRGHLGRIVGALFLTSFCLVMGRQGLFRRNSLQGSSSVLVLQRWTGGSTVKCATQCAGMTECKTFSIRPSLQECSLYPRRITLLDLVYKSPHKQEFYWKINGHCPTDKGYVMLPGNQKCLRLGSASKNWTEAEAACEADGGHLAIIEDVATWETVRAFMEAVAPAETWAVYLGGVRSMDGRLLWLDGRAVEEELWLPGEPNDSNGGGENCLDIIWNQKDTHTFLLNDELCSLGQHFLCQM